MTEQRRVLPVWPLAVLVSIFFLGQQLGRETFVFAHVFTERAVDVIAALLKLGGQLTGCVFAARCALRYEKGNPVRPGWMLVGAWLGTFFLGQLVLGFYKLILGHSAPVPSLADLFFFTGYACVIPAVVLFLRAYRDSGFEVGRLRDLLLLALGVCLLFALVGYRVLVPIALAPTPLDERVVNVGYPLLDLVLLIPTLVLLRMTVRFHGGRVWTVWAALLAGIVCAAGADLLFADVSEENLMAFGPLGDLLFILSYVFSAHGARLQYAMVTD